MSVCQHAQLIVKLYSGRSHHDKGHTRGSSRRKTGVNTERHPAEGSKMRRSQSLKTMDRAKTAEPRGSSPLLLARETNISANVNMCGQRVTLSPPSTAAKGKRPSRHPTTQSGQQNQGQTRLPPGNSVKFENDACTLKSRCELATKGSTFVTRKGSTTHDPGSGDSPSRFEVGDRNGQRLAGSKKKPLIQSRLGGPFVSNCLSPKPDARHATSKLGEELRVSDAPRTKSHAYGQNRTLTAAHIGDYPELTMEHAASGKVSLLRILRRNEELLEQMETLARKQRESQHRELEALEKLRAIKETQAAGKKKREDENQRITQANQTETKRLKNELTQKTNEVRRLRNDLERANSALIRTTQPAFARSHSQISSLGTTAEPSYLQQRRESRLARQNTRSENHKERRSHVPLHHHDVSYPYPMGDPLGRSLSTQYVRVDTTRLPLAAISRTAFRTSEDWAQCLVNDESLRRKNGRK